MEPSNLGGIAVLNVLKGRLYNACSTIPSHSHFSRRESTWQLVCRLQRRLSNIQASDGRDNELSARIDRLPCFVRIANRS